MIRNSIVNQRSLDIFVASATALVAAVLALLVPPNIVLIRIVTLPLVLILPGYAFTSALFPNRSLGVPQRLVFSVGLSLLIVILGGLALNWTPFGLQASSWAVLLSSITLGASAVALLRRHRQSAPAAGWMQVANVGFAWRQGMLMGLAALIVCGAVAVSIIGAARQTYPGYTQLWILPVGGANSKDEVQLGVSNSESASQEYLLVVNFYSEISIKWPPIYLNPNEKWVNTLSLPTITSADAAKVEADLYRADAPTTIYRHVVLWLST